MATLGDVSGCTSSPCTGVPFRRRFQQERAHDSSLLTGPIIRPVYGEPPEIVEMPLQGTIASQLADIETPAYMSNAPPAAK